MRLRFSARLEIMKRNGIRSASGFDQPFAPVGFHMIGSMYVW